MKKEFLFLFLFLLIIGGIYFLYKKNSPAILKSPSQNQKSVTPAIEKEEGLTVKEISQGLILEVTQPKDKTTVNSPEVTVAGKTNAGVDVFVNEKELKADNGGNFSTTLNLDEGENVITVVVSDNQGNYAEKELIVTLETIE